MVKLKAHSFSFLYYMTEKKHISFGGHTASYSVGAGRVQDAWDFYLWNS
jgi:hypothetical protein